VINKSDIMKMLKGALSLIMLTFLCVGGYSQGLGLNSPVPVDPNFRMGVLDNGLHYYIRHNATVKERADFYIAQNVGAILEEDPQNGLAHFLEHMAFNGTKNYPDKKLIESLEKIGVKFGENINAFTSLDETVYNLSDVPVARQSAVDSAVLILHDWSGFILLRMMSLITNVALFVKSGELVEVPIEGCPRSCFQLFLLGRSMPFAT